MSRIVRGGSGLSFLRVARPVFFGLALFGLLLCPRPARAAQPASVETIPLVAEQFEKLNLEELESFLRRVDEDIEGRMSGFSLRQVLASIREGKLELDPVGILKSLLDVFFREILTHTALLGKLLILGAILAVLEHLQSAFEQNTVAQLAHSVGVISLLTVALGSFTLALNTGREAIGNMVGLMQSLIPVLLTLMAALGSLTTVALMHPVIFISLNVLGTLMRNIVFPLIFCAAILGIVNQISDRFQVSRLADIFRDGSVLLVGLFLTIFIGILGIQGVAGAVTDGVGLRTAKFLTGAFVPVIGGVLSDAVEAVLGCSLFLKNAVGILGTLALLLACAIPIAKILSAALIYRLAAALMQPLGAERLGEALHLLGNYLFIVFAAVATVGLMFFVALAIIVGLGNFAVILR